MQPTGEQLLALARTRIGQKYILGSFVPKDNPHYNGPWDCAEFMAWLVYQITSRLYGCENDNGAAATAKADAYTGYFGRDAHALGIIIDIDEAARTPGAMLLRLAGDGTTGHIVMSDGNYGTVEAHSTARGVIQSVIPGRRFDMGILIPWITYNTNPKHALNIAGPRPATVYRFTKPMMQGAAVKAIQQALISAGLVITADGFYGQDTFKAVRSYQLGKGLNPDGEVGPETAKQLGVTL